MFHTIEDLIVKSVFGNSELSSRIMPYLTADWFSDEQTRVIVRQIKKLYDKNSELPIPTEVALCLPSDDYRKKFEDIINIPSEEVKDSPTILSHAEKFVRDSLMKNVGYKMLNDLSNGDNQGDYAEELAQAQGFSFETSVGLDLFEDEETLYDSEIAKMKIYPCGVKAIDYLLRGGFHEKSFNLFLACTNVGKTMTMCSLGLNFAKMGFDVLYLTFEDGDTMIAKRLLQNMFDTDQDMMHTMSKQNFHNKFMKAKGEYKGHFLIYEFDEDTVNTNRVKALIKEVKEKKHFKPHIVMIDYVNCMIPNGGVSSEWNTNTIGKKVATEVKTMAMKEDIVTISVAQTNRGGVDAVNLSLKDFAECYGQATKADAVFAETQSEAFKQANIMAVTMLKTRYGKHKDETVQIGIDTELQRVFDTSFSDTLDMSHNLGDIAIVKADDPLKPTNNGTDEATDEENDEMYVYDESQGTDDNGGGANAMDDSEWL